LEVSTPKIGARKPKKGPTPSSKTRPREARDSRSITKNLFQQMAMCDEFYPTFQDLFVKVRDMVSNRRRPNREALKEWKKDMKKCK